jgi:hypothetical protein
MEEQVTGGVFVAALVGRRQGRAEVALAAAWHLDLDRDAAHVHLAVVVSGALVVLGAVQIGLSLGVEEVVEQPGQESVGAELTQAADEGAVDLVLQGLWSSGRLGLHDRTSRRERARSSRQCSFGRPTCSSS